MKLKVMAYVVRREAGGWQLLVFEHAGDPQAGVQVPAGTVEPGEPLETALWRELFEESGIWLGANLTDADSKRKTLLSGEMTFATLVLEAPIDFASLVWTSRWITPIGVPKRFDTYFFLATIGRDAIASAENVEAVEVTWISPSDAIEKLQIVFPTQKNLEAIAGFSTAEELLASRRGAEIATTRPTPDW